MLGEFALYLQLGFRHIADFAGYDHLLFVTALAIPYSLREWRRLAILVTAFTVGHSVTLALATLRLVSVPSAVVETLIPVTILVTALLSWTDISGDASTVRVPPARYLLAAGFGLIHGLGFSNYLRALLGQEESIALPLFAFNIGLELGQLLILSIVLAIGALVVPTALSTRNWRRLLVFVTASLSATLLAQRLIQEGHGV